MINSRVLSATLGALAFLVGLPAAAVSAEAVPQERSTPSQEAPVLQSAGESSSSTCSCNEDCNDGNSCTTDTCTAGVCSHQLLACVNGQSCNTDPIPTLTSQEQAEPLLACTPHSNGQPSLQLYGKAHMKLECGKSIWTDPGARAWNATCNPITVHTFNSGHDAYGPGPNTCVEGTYSVQYVAWDAHGRTVSAVRSVQVDDTKAPTLKLKGAKHMKLQCGHGYVEPGWEAWDACYGDVTPEVHTSGYPNGWVAGTYEVTYTLKDSGGNSAPTQKRRVDVVNCP